MFDWNNQEQGGLTIWGELNDAEDHTVPYPKDSEDSIVFSFDDHNKKQSNKEVNTTATSTGQSSGGKSEFSGSILQNNSSLTSANEQSGTRFDMDTWSDLLSLNSEFTTRGLPSLDGESELFGNVRGNKESDNFLGCDWDNIGDFDDFNRMLRDESIFGHDMIPNVDDFLSSSADLTGTTSQSIPMSDVPLSSGQDQGCSSYQSIDHFSAKRKVEDKTADILETKEQTVHQIHQTDQLKESDERKKKLLKSRKKTEERSENKASEILDDTWSQNITRDQQILLPLNITPPQAIQSLSFTHPRQVSDTDSQFIYPQYGYPAYPFPGTPILQNGQVPEMQSKGIAMTPQEKIEKLRWRQQTQAMLSIQQQQQQQLVHQNMGAENMAPQSNAMSRVGVEEYEKILSPSGANILSEIDESRVTDDNSRRTIYYQLQDTVGKLDTRVRLCIRDSLLRLARSSMERQNPSERNSSNATTKDDSRISAIEEANHGRRHKILQDEETYTNPIDRMVAHLLFHKPLEISITPMKNGMTRSHFLCNPE